MDALSTFVRRSIPDYLSGLPVPNSVGGYFSLSGELSNQFMTGLIILISIYEPMVDKTLRLSI